MINVFYDSYCVLNKVYSEKAFVKQAINGTFIEEKNRPKTTKIVYGVLDNDVRLSYYISRLCPKNPKLVVRTILKIAMYNIEFLGKSPYAVTDSSVTLCKKLGKGGMSGFVNAVLRKFIDEIPPLPQEKIQRLSVEYSYPLFLVKKLISSYGEDKAVKIMSCDTERTCVRFNKGANGEEYLDYLRFAYEKTPFDGAYFVNGFKRNKDFDEGIYTFQSVGSVAICDAVSGGKTLLDACSAPGGKTVNLADKFEQVTAFELHAHRAQLIKEYASRMKKHNITVEQRDSSVYDDSLNEKFDAVLLDSPCSGTGVLKDNPDIKLNRTEEDIKNLIEIQKKLIFTVSNYVKVGGYLYYSTCSILKEENADIISDFLSKTDRFEEEKIQSKLNGIYTKHGLQFTPDVSFGAGFFVCKLRRIK